MFSNLILFLILHRQWICQTKTYTRLSIGRGNYKISHLTTWQGSDIPLQVHHVNGDRTDNTVDNLKVLCCNCHGLTDNWKNRKRIVSS
jgi:hypothetical protein